MGVVVAAVAAKDLTVPVIVAAFLAAVLISAVDWLSNHGLTRSLGSLLVLVSLVLVVAVTGVLVAEAVASQRDELSEQIGGSADELASWFADLDQTTVDSVRDGIGGLSSNAGTGGVLSSLFGFASSTIAFFTGLLFAALVLYYLLKDGHTAADWLADRRGQDAARRDEIRQLIHESARDVQRYAYGKTMLALAQGVVITVSAALLGVPNALALGLINFVGAYVPYVGAFIGGGVAVLVGLASGGVPVALAMVAVALVANLVIENALEPRLLGSVLKLHPLVVLIVTVAGGLFAGIIGLIIAAPTAAIIRRAHVELVASGFYGEYADERAVQAAGRAENS